MSVVDSRLSWSPVDPYTTLKTKTCPKSANLKGPQRGLRAKHPFPPSASWGHTDNGCFETALELERITNQVTVDHIIGGLTARSNSIVEMWYGHDKIVDFRGWHGGYTHR